MGECMEIRPDFDEGEIHGQGSICWKTHPARRRPRKALAAVCFILGFAILVYVIYRSPAWALFSILVLFFSLSRFFLPSTTTLTGEYCENVFLGFRRRRPWSAFHRVERVSGGVFLSPFPEPNRLEHYRGWFLICGDNREEVFEFACKCINPPERAELASKDS